MNELYKKSILIFGMVIPVLILGLVVIIVMTKAKSINTTYLTKKAQYDQAQMTMQMTKQLKAKVDAERSQLKSWEDLLARETRGTFIDHWKQAQNKFTEKELNKISHNWVNQSVGLGSNADQSASQVKMSFLGTFRAMQLSLLEVETKLPQLQLDSMQIKTMKNSNLLSFDTTFTLWTQ
ncbi:MAG: hypothetical protein ACSHX0_04840 [Akkermansiaceae bacterium]